MLSEEPFYTINLDEDLLSRRWCVALVAPMMPAGRPSLSLDRLAAPIDPDIQLKELWRGGQRRSTAASVMRGHRSCYGASFFNRGCARSVSTGC